MISVRLLALSSLFKNDSVRARAEALPFGDAEAERRARLAPSALDESVGAWLALQELTEHRSLPLPLTVTRDENGKPHFENPSLPDFNLSHTDGLVAAVLGDEQSGSVGIDVQIRKELRRPNAIAARFLGADAQDALDTQPWGEDSFFVLWTKTEAVAKQSGNGILSELTIGNERVYYTRSYRILYGGCTAYLTVATEHPIHEIEILSDKEISLYELPN